MKVKWDKLTVIDVFATVKVSFMIFTVEQMKATASIGK